MNTGVIKTLIATKGGRTGMREVIFIEKVICKKER